jgi:hypothetical protein
MATAVVTLGCPPPATLATQHARGGLTVSADGTTMAAGNGTTLVIPEHAQTLLGGWVGRSLLPGDWAGDVTSTYLTVERQSNDSDRLSVAQVGAYAVVVGYLNCVCWVFAEQAAVEGVSDPTTAGPRGEDVVEALVGE